MPRLARIFTAFCFMLVLGWQSVASSAQPVVDPAIYQVGIGDVLAVSIYRVPDFNTVTEVAADGTIALSLIGKVPVAGLSPAQIGERVGKRLDEAGYFRNPVVNVMVQTYRSQTVSVLGNVTKPGEYPLERQIRASEMLARAGALLGQGSGSIELVRQGGEKRTILAADILNGRIDIPLQPHDTLIVNEAPNFFVSGEVQKAGSYTLEPGLTVGRAIALAGGLTPRGSRNRVKITRKTPDGERTLKSDSDELVQSDDLIVIGSRLF